ncbi:MAG: hypothetical protein AB7T32_05325 [Dehalococcoidia bacterium]
MTRLRHLGSAQSLAIATWMVALIGTALVAILALRVWLQLTGETDSTGLLGLGYSASAVLVGPFQSFEPSTPIENSGILDFSTLVAIEAYLIATLVALTLMFSARLAVFAAPRVVHRRQRKVLSKAVHVPARETPST